MQLAVLALVLYWLRYQHLPWTGAAVAILAGLAALMSVHPDISPRHKFVYLALMAALLLTEFRAMRKDREEAAQSQSALQTEEDGRLQKMLDGERESTKALIEDETQKFNLILQQDQEAFGQSLRAILRAHKEDETSFSRVVDKQEGLVSTQRELTERVSGRLIPGSAPTPDNPCMRSPMHLPASYSPITVIAGDNAATLGRLPSVVLQIGAQQVIAVDRVPSEPDELALALDFRYADNSIALRLNKDGVVTRSTDLILLQPDKSTFLVQDKFGADFLKLEYLNSKTFAVSGNIIYCGKRIPVQVPYLHDSCAGTGGGIAYSFGGQSCPAQPPQVK